jgi:hypothetical protein
MGKRVETGCEAWQRLARAWVAGAGVIGAIWLGQTPLAEAAPFNPISVDATKTRIFMPLKQVRISKQTTKIASWHLEATSQLPGRYNLNRDIHQGALHHLSINTYENRTYIKAHWRHTTPVRYVARPGGLEIIFYHEQTPPRYRDIAKGVRYWEGQLWGGAGPMRTRVLKLEPSQVTVQPVLAGNAQRMMGTSRLSAMARWHGAIAAVNGSFFAPRTGQPQGTLILNGRLVSRTMLDRPSIWLKQDGSARIEVAKPSAAIVLDDGTTLTCQGVNEATKRHRITLFTDHFGPNTRTSRRGGHHELAVNAAGTVVAEGNGSLRIPPGGYVLSGQGKGAANLRRAIGMGQQLRLTVNVAPSIQHALGGGPTLVEKAKIRIKSREQHFRADVAHGRAPRTAFGVTADGHYLLACIDGRKPGYSVGATLKELAKTMRMLGATDALNLDGGGSTTMWVKGRTVNAPSDGRERPISTALVVLPRKDNRIAHLTGDPLALFFGKHPVNHQTIAP